MKLLKFQFALLCLLTISSFTTYAQFGMGKIDEIEEVQKRKLIVMIEEPRERMLKGSSPSTEDIARKRRMDGLGHHSTNSKERLSLSIQVCYTRRDGRSCYERRRNLCIRGGAAVRGINQFEELGDVHKVEK